MKKIQNVVHWVLLCGVLVGCAALPAPPSEPVREQWGTLVIVPVRYPPKANISSFAMSKGSGATKGAAAGATAGFAATGVFAAGNTLTAVIAPYLALAVVPVAAGVGAHYGSHAAMSEQDAAALEASVQHHLTALGVPQTLGHTIRTTAQRDVSRDLPLITDAGPAAPETVPDYRSLAQRGADTVLEVAATQVGFTGGKQLRFYLVANVRLVRVSDGSQFYAREFVYQSDEYSAQLWGESQAALFAAELQRGYASLAESAVEQVFLLTELRQVSISHASGEARPRGLGDLLAGREACGLAWISPERKVALAVSVDAEDHLNRFPTVDSDQPTLVWESFPRDFDRKADVGRLLSDLRNVRYDLQVWQVVADSPPRLVYERRDLPAPSHTLEQPLPPGSRYFWSARARYDLGGVVHGTKWGYFRTPWYEVRGVSSKVKAEPSVGAVLGPILAGAAPRDPCTLDFIPTNNYYRFQTP